MRVAMLYNPRSGSGLATRLADEFGRAAAGAGHVVAWWPTQDEAGRPKPGITAGDLAGVGVLAVAGGDGTVHRAGPVAAEAGCPLYHVPAGTENLFARHYGMTRDPGRFLRALAQERTVPMDVGWVGGQSGVGGGVRGRPFLLMASVGPDAGVIQRLHGVRVGVISHWSYLKPVLSELLDPRLPLLSVRVDGASWIERSRGLLVIGNSPHYAWGLNPARGARADDGLLDAAFYPSDTVVDTVCWAAKLLAHREGPLAGVSVSRGREVEVWTPDPGGTLLQMDGEVGPAWSSLGEGGWVRFGLGPKQLRVLDPGEGR